jgi:hypothetical protein
MGVLTGFRSSLDLPDAGPIPPEWALKSDGVEAVTTDGALFRAMP